MQIFKSRLIRFLIVPQLMAAMVVGPVWGSAQLVTGGTAAGIVIDGPNDSDDTNAEPEDGVTISTGVIVEGAGSPSISITGADVFTGQILNHGHIDDGIEITENVTTSTATNGIIRVENTTGGDQASLHRGLIIQNTTTVSSSTSDIAHIGDSGYIDFITVENGSSLNTTGVGKHAINVGTGGQLGGPFNNLNVGGNAFSIVRSESDTVIDASGTISSENGAAINIDGAATGEIAVTGALNGQENVNGDGNGAITIGGIYTGTIANTGSINDAIVITGAHAANGHAITSTGTLGSSTTETVIQVGGSLSSTTGNALNLGGTVNGSIVNNGVITNGVLISGTQEAASSAYKSLGTAGASASLTGGFTVAGTVTSTGTEPAISIGNYSSVDTITVNSGSSLLADPTMGTAIFVGEQSASISTGIVNEGTIRGSIDNDGTIGAINNTSSVITNTTNSSLLGNIENSGTINGSISNSGTIDGYIENSGNITSGISSTGTFNGHAINSGTIAGGITLSNQTAIDASAYNSSVSTGSTSLTGGYTVDGTVTSNQDTIVLVDNASIDNITVNDGATLNTTGVYNATTPVANVNGDAINVGGSSSLSGTLLNDGTITGDITNAGTIGTISNNNTGTLAGSIDNSGTISAITNTGTFTGAITNTGAGSIGSITVQTQDAGAASAYSSSGTSSLTSYTANGLVSTTHNDAVSIGAGTSVGSITIGSTGNLAGATNAINNMGSITAGIDNNGTLTGSIANSGSIAGGIALNNQNAGTGTVYSSESGTLTGGYTVDAGGVVETSGAIAVSIGATSGTTDTVPLEVDTITINGTLKAGKDDTAINLTAAGDVTTIEIASGGVLGDATDNGGGIVNAGFIGTITNSGWMYGAIANSGFITNGVSINNQSSGDFSAYSSTGSATLEGGLTIFDNGSLTSASSEGTIKIGDGTANANTIDSITINSGAVLTSTGTGSKAIVVTAGNNVTGGIVNNGSINGAIVNSGSITGGIDTAGKSGAGSAYIGEDGSTLSGGFEVTGGTVTSTDDHAIWIKNGAAVDQISVTAGTLSTSGDNKNAVQLDDGAVLGDDTPTELETIISVSDGAAVDATGINGIGINIETNLIGKIQVDSGGRLNGTSAAISLGLGKILTGSIENNGSINKIISIKGTQSSIADAIKIGATGNLGNVQTDTIIEIATSGSLSSTDGDAINITGNTTGEILVNGAISSGQINIASAGDYTGTIDVNGGSVADGISISGTHISSGTGINITNNGSVGNDSSGNAIHITSTGSLTSQASNGSAIKLSSTGSSITGSIRNEGNILGDISLSGAHTAVNEAIINTGTINGDLAINNSQNNSPSGSNSDIRNEGTINGDITVSGNPTLISSSRSAYSSEGTSGDRSLLNGTYQLSSNRTVSTTTDTVNIGEYSDIKKIGIDAGAVLSSTGSNKRAIYIAEDASLGTTSNENDVVLQVDGELSSTQGSALEVEGDITGAIHVTSTGLVSGKGGSTDAAILFDSSDSNPSPADHQAVIQNHGVIKGQIYVDTNQTLTSYSAYSSSGSNTNWAVLNGVGNNGRGYTVDDGATVTSATNTIAVGSYSYIDSIQVDGAITSTGSSNSAIYVSSNGQLGGTLATSMVTGGRLTNDIIRSVTDTVINVSSSGHLSSSSGAAIRVDGSVTGVIRIDDGGTVTGNTSLGAIAINSVMTGAISNSGIITGGIVVGSTGQLTGDIINNEKITGNIVSSGTLLGDIQNTDQLVGSIVINGGLTTGSITNSGTITGGFGVASAGRLNGDFINSGSMTGNTVTDGRIDGNLINTGTQNGNITVSGIHNGYIKNTGTLTGNIISGGTRAGNVINASTLNGGITTSGTMTGDIENTGIISGNINISSGQLNGNIVNNGTVNGIVRSTGTLDGKVKNRGTLGSSSSTNVIDFSGSVSALDLIQIKENAADASHIRGRIIGSSHSDTVDLREGTFNGNISGVEHLIISDDSNITIDGDFTLPERTSVYLDDSLNSNHSLITASGTAFAEAAGSILSFMPEDNAAYLSLYNNGPVVTVVDAQAVDGNALERITASAGSALLQTRTFTENGDIKVEIRASTSEDVNGVMGQALLAALNSNAHPDDSRKIILNLNRSEKIVGELEDDVRPDTSGSTHTAPRAIAMASQSIVFDRINSLRGSGLNFGDDGFGFGLYGSSYDESGSSSSNVDEEDSSDYSSNTSSKREREIRHMDYTLLNGGSFWGQMMLLEGNQDQKPSTDGYNNRAGGIVLGIDSIVLDRFRLGVAATYGYGVVNTENDRSTESHNFLGTIYGSMEYDSFFVDLMFSGGTASNTVEQLVRNIQTNAGLKNEKITGDYNSHQWNLKSVIGYRFALGSNWEFTPLAELNYGKVYFESYKPKGHPIHPDNIDIRDYSALELGLGFSIKGLIQSGKQYIEPDFTLMSHRDLHTTGSKVEYSFLGIDAQQVLEGPARDSQRYSASFGLYFDLGRNWYVRTGYDYNWSQTYRSHGLNAKFRYDF